MAKAQAMKPKSSLAGFFGRFGGGKSKAATRPASAQSTTMTNLQAASGPATRGGSKGASSKAPARSPSRSMAQFRLPLIGGRPLTFQLQVLGALALLLLVGTAFMVFEDTQLRTRNATYINITSQMQFHTQRLAKAAGLAARGQASAFEQLQDSRDEFAAYLQILRDGGYAFNVDLPKGGVGTTDELRSRVEELSQRWPESANAASAILAAQKRAVTERVTPIDELPPRSVAIPARRKRDPKVVAIWAVIVLAAASLVVMFFIARERDRRAQALREEQQREADRVADLSPPTPTPPPMEPVAEPAAIPDAGADEPNANEPDEIDMSVDASVATEEKRCSLLVNVLTRNSAPCGTPAALKRRATMSVSLDTADALLLQATTKSPSASMATLGSAWLNDVVVLTRNSPPCATPAAL